MRHHAPTSLVQQLYRSNCTAYLIYNVTTSSRTNVQSLSQFIFFRELWRSIQPITCLRRSVYWAMGLCFSMENFLSADGFYAVFRDLGEGSPFWGNLMGKSELLGRISRFRDRGSYPLRFAGIFLNFLYKNFSGHRREKFWRV